MAHLPDHVIEITIPVISAKANELQVLRYKVPHFNPN
jgi:hypothetical protein